MDINTMTEKKNIISNNGAVDEELLKKFFADSVRMRIDDNGFADNVMRRLPEEIDARCYRMYNLWTAVMAAACVVVFFLVDGFDILKTRIVSMTASMLSSMSDSIHNTLSHISLPTTMSASITPYTPLVVTLALIIIGSMILKDLKESA